MSCNCAALAALTERQRPLCRQAATQRPRERADAPAMLDLHSGELALFVIRVVGVTINLAVWAVVLAVLWLQRRYWKGRAAVVGVENDRRVWSMVLRWYATAVLGAAAANAGELDDQAVRRPLPLIAFALATTHALLRRRTRATAFRWGALDPGQGLEVACRSRRRAG